MMPAPIFAARAKRVLLVGGRHKKIRNKKYNHSLEKKYLFELIKIEKNL